MTRGALTWLVRLLLVVLVACSNQDARDGEGEGAVEVVMATASALSASDVASLTVTVTGAGIAAPITKSFVRTSGVWKGIIDGIPAGTNRTLTGKAYDATSVLVFKG